MMNENVIVAAGAVIWRKVEKGQLEILVIHRPRYDDWSLPKGKVNAGESLISCAHRDVMEETGLSVVFGPRLGEIEYFVEGGLKRVTYWAAKAKKKQSEFFPNEEVDRIEWLNFEDALNRVTKDSDREVLIAFINSPYKADVLVMLRHAQAITREEWLGEEMDRPLSAAGVQQARRLTPLYEVYGLDQIYTSDAIRCYDTVEFLSRNLDIKLKVKKDLSEDRWEKDKDNAYDFFKEIIKEDGNTLVCSHNPILHKALNKLSKKFEGKEVDKTLDPAEAFVVLHDKKRILAIETLPAPAI